ILAVIALSAGIMAFMPGTLPLSAGHILRVSITFGLSIGFAVIGAVWVAQRFLESREDEAIADPPIAELALGALIVAGLSAALRIAIPLVPALIEGSSSALPDAITQFLERWPGVIIPSACTMSLGLLCTYLGARPWSKLRIAAAGALGNGLAFMAAAPVVGWLLSDDVLLQVFKQLDYARVHVLVNTGLIGVVIGFMVLWQFKQSEHDRLVDAAHAAERAGSPTLEVLPATEELDSTAPSRPDIAARHYGGCGQGRGA